MFRRTGARDGRDSCSARDGRDSCSARDGRDSCSARDARYFLNPSNYVYTLDSALKYDYVQADAEIFKISTVSLQYLYM